MKERISIVYITNKYINFLHKFDSNVMFNKCQTRPYIGILFEIDDLKYYAPLTSPKEKFKTMKNSEDFTKLMNGQYGAINFNNMIPVVKSEIIPIDIYDILDKKYKLLLINQRDYINSNAEKLLTKAIKLYTKYNNNTLHPAIKKRCCNYKLLESKAKFFKN